jgi:hypothetical protein
MTTSSSTSTSTSTSASTSEGQNQPSTARSESQSQAEPVPPLQSQSQKGTKAKVPIRNGNTNSMNNKTNDTDNDTDIFNLGFGRPRSGTEHGVGARIGGSPLAKIFGKPAFNLNSISGSSSGSRSAKGNSGVVPGSTWQNDHLELDKVKDELKEVRESQLRMEELLNKVLSGK